MEEVDCNFEDFSSNITSSDQQQTCSESTYSNCESEIVTITQHQKNSIWTHDFYRKFALAKVHKTPKIINTEKSLHRSQCPYKTNKKGSQIVHMRNDRNKKIFWLQPMF